MRAPLAHSPSTTHGSALVPLDTANREKLLYSNPRLLRSSQLGETCPPPAHAEGMAAMMALLRQKRYFVSVQFSSKFLADVLVLAPNFEPFIVT